MNKVAILIPCYNEELRLSPDAVAQLHNTTTADIYLCNDGSTDGTAALLTDISNGLERCFAINYTKNSGKANTIYRAANEVLAKGQYTHIGYFDADFSTPVSEINRLLHYADQYPERFVMGSRVKLLNYNIHRKTHRHIIGRIIITLANTKLKLGIYDTQCGAKIFPAGIATEAFSEPFQTSWLFDMEIFLKLKKKGLLQYGSEFPLLEWKDVDGSKLSWKSGIKILKEMIILSRIRKQ